MGPGKKHTMQQNIQSKKLQNPGYVKQVYHNADFMLNGTGANGNNNSSKRSKYQEVNFFKAEKLLYADAKSALGQQPVRKKNLHIYLNPNMSKVISSKDSQRIEQFM